MKSLLTITLFLLYTIQASAQTPLVADAGPDKYWCLNMTASGTDTPRLGGINPASGGTAPYTYQWTFRTMQSVFLNRYIDSPSIAHPIINEMPQSTNQQNTGYAILTVRDANGVEAKDSAAIYFQHIISSLGTSSTYKNVNDTITIGAGQAQDQFPPYHGYKWWPSTGLVDTTVAYPRCFISHFMTYNNSYFDSVGCSLCCGDAIIEIRPNSITGVNPATEEVRVFAMNNRMVMIEGSMKQDGTFFLYDANGKQIFLQRLERGQHNMNVSSDIAEGIYIYKLKMQDGTQRSGKINLH